MTAWHCWISLVAAGFHCQGALHLLGEDASHPIKPRCTLLAVLQIRAMPQASLWLCAQQGHDLR